MKKGWFGVGVLVVGLVSLLGILAYALDHLRATTRVVPGLGEAAEPGREEAPAVPEGEGEDIESTRLALPLALREPSGLVVRVMGERGERIFYANVLAYRGDELLRAERAAPNDTATLIPFDGPGSLRVEHDGFELARLEIPEGRGRYEIVVPRQASVAGIVRVDGVPREGIRLGFTRGSEDWLGAWVAYGLETAGLHERPARYGESTKADGSFRYEWLPPDWSGVLHLVDYDDYRFTNGARRLELAYPQEGQVLELEALRPELEFHGRVVCAGQPVPGASWEWSSSGWGRCDELGRFSIHAFADELKGVWLEFSQHELGARRVELGEAGTRSDLGDVELLPNREVVFLVRSESGAPIAGARARPRSSPRHLKLSISEFQSVETVNPFASLSRTSDATDSAGRGVLTSLRPGENTICVSARGYAMTDALVPEGVSDPLVVVLPRCAAVQVVLRDRSGRVPPGLSVRLEARGPTFTWADGYDPEGDELTPDNVFGGGNQGKKDDGYSGEFWLDGGGRAWIDALRPGVPVDLSAVDEYGTAIASARKLVLAPGEWRRVDFRVEAEPRTLLVVVRDALGHPLPGVNVNVWIPPGTEPGRSQLYTDRAGMVRTEPLYSDDVTLRASRRGFESRTLEHMRVPPEGATVELRLAHDWWQW
jgi:hypothetical protein